MTFGEPSFLGIQIAAKTNTADGGIATVSPLSRLISAASGGN
jgi:hypothetical protein